MSKNKKWYNLLVDKASGYVVPVVFLLDANMQELFRKQTLE